MQRAGDGAGGMVGLLGRGPEQHVQRVADNLHDGAAMCEHDIRHLPEIVVEQRRDDRRVERLDQRGKVGDVGEHRGDLAPLPGKFDGAGGKLRRQIGREVTRQRGMRLFGLGLPALRLASLADMAEGLVNGYF